MDNDCRSTAEDLACTAAEALMAGDSGRAMPMLAEALRLDPLNAYANILMSDHSAPGTAKRIQYARDALEGASRYLGHAIIQRPDQRHLTRHVIAALGDHLTDLGRPRARPRLPQHHADGTSMTALRDFERTQPFHDAWDDMQIRDYLRALFALGKALAEGDRPAEAVIHFRELLTQSPWDRFGCAPWLVAALIRLGMYTEAEQWVEIYEDNSDTGFPSAFWTRLARGLVCIARGEYDEAYEALGHAYDVDDPTNIVDLLAIGKKPPQGFDLELSDAEIARSNIWRAFQPTVMAKSIFQDAIKAACAD